MVELTADLLGEIKCTKASCASGKPSGPALELEGVTEAGFSRSDQMHLLPVFSCPPTHPCCTNCHLGPSPADDRHGSSHCSSEKDWVAPSHLTVPARVTFRVTNLDTDAIDSNLRPKYLCGFVPQSRWLSQSRVMLTTSQRFQNLWGFCRVHKLHRREPLPTFRGCTYLLKVLITYTNDWELCIFSAKVLDQMALHTCQWKQSRSWHSSLESSGKFVKNLHTHRVTLLIVLQWNYNLSILLKLEILLPCFPPWLYESNLTLLVRPDDLSEKKRKEGRLFLWFYDIKVSEHW